MTRIALCVIAKDEAAFLPACLASAREAVDEIVVADTGSTDGTQALAEAAGARVIHHPWTDDFAAARNAALAAATCPWVLLLDADECLVPGAAEMLRAAVARDDFDCGELPLYDAQTTDVRPEDLSRRRGLFKDAVYLQRLFRRTPDLRWEGAVHENVRTWLEGRARRRIEAAIVHYGNVPAVREARGKNERNYRLLEKAAAARPDDLHTQAYFLAEAFRRDKGPDTRDLAAAVWARWCRAGSDVRARLIPVVTMHTWFLVEAGAYTDALAVLHKAHDIGADHPHLHWMAGICRENLAAGSRGAPRTDALAAARAAYAACRAMAEQAFASEVTWGVTTWMSDTALGRVCLRLGDVDAAHEAYARALALLDDLDHPGEEPARFRTQAALGRMHTWLLCDDVKAAMRALRADKRLPAADAELLRADAYERSNHFGEMLKRVERLVADPPELVYVEGARMLAELVAVINLYKGTPAPGDGPVGTVSAVLAGHDLAYLQDPPFLDKNRLRRVLEYVISSRGAATFNVFTHETTQTALPRLSRVVCALTATKQN